MAGESQKEPTTGQADPSVLTTEQLQRAVRNLEKQFEAELAVRDERLDGIDRATVVFQDTLTKFPTEVQKEIGHIRELVFERLTSVERLDIVREEHRLELKADAEKALSTAREADQKAVAAALAAAEKARDQQTIASQLATNKAETSFIDSLQKQQETFTLAIANVVSGQNDLKDRITGIEQRQFASTESRNTQRLDMGQVLAFLGFIVAAIAVIYAVTR